MALSSLHLTAMSLIELKRRAKLEKRSRTRIRYLAVCLFVEGKSRADIARFLKVARGSVNKWVSNYLNIGIDALADAENYGRPPRLSPEQLSLLKEFVETSLLSDSGGRLQAKDVQEFLSVNFNVDYKPSNIYRLLHHLNFSWITSRSKHPKQSIEAQTAFKKLPAGNDPSHTRPLTTRSS